MNMLVDPKAGRSFLERRERARQRVLDQRFAQAQRDVQAIVSLIVAKYKPRRLYQWGSLLHRPRFWEHSDVDIAVEGILDVKAFFAMYGEADHLTSLPLDLVALEHIEPEFRDLIRAEGRMIYEQ